MPPAPRSTRATARIITLPSFVLTVAAKKPPSAAKSTTVNSNSALFKVNDNGKRSPAGTLSPTATAEMTYGGGMAYFTRRYVQEMDAIMTLPQQM